MTQNENSSKTVKRIGVIIVLSIIFLILVYLTVIAGLDPGPEVVIIGLVPVLITLLISEIIVLTEIQTPKGYKLLFDILGSSESEELILKGEMAAEEDILRFDDMERNIKK
ncbi:hypothetical protein [Natrialbaceae archaeon AArc-T1-2]|uniref:hypothetical protein n=1 Tax=Natrialbaceae archaeon AArc-T1-2 TaxID=3053904 RepID=UPI00255AAD6A|nr:hypothetical protein [Natrialbaceae archaeon AArc-T1-2]WIV66849.1 hypothetical protein QQ977_14315 [Natrialbaceae archaeon AArc-T1-2]